MFVKYKCYYAVVCTAADASQ